MLRYPVSVSVSVMYFARYALAYRTLTTQVLRVTSRVLRSAFNKSLYFAYKIVRILTGIIIVVLLCSHVFSELPDEKSSLSNIYL